MLKDLQVLNGDMTLEFDPLNTIYTINVASDVESLELDYDIDSDTQVSIKGNNLTKEINEVVLSVYKNEEVTSYYLYVYKDNEDTVVQTLNDYSSLNIEKEEISEYAVPVISSLCFLIIILTFTLLFGRKTKK